MGLEDVASALSAGSGGPLSSVGPAQDAGDEPSRVLPDSEFYDVGSSVSGFFNFGGVRSVRAGWLSLTSSTRSSGLGFTDTVTDTATSKSPDFVVVDVNPARSPHTSRSSTDKPKRQFAPPPRSRRKARRFPCSAVAVIAFLGVVAAASTVAIVVTANVRGKTDELPPASGLVSDPTGAPTAAPVATLAPTSSELLGTSTPTASSTAAPSVPGELPGPPTPSPVAGGGDPPPAPSPPAPSPPVPGQPISIESMLNERMYSRSCSLDACVAYVTVQATVRNSGASDLELTAWGGRLDHRYAQQYPWETMATLALASAGTPVRLPAEGSAVVTLELVTYSIDPDFLDLVLLPALVSCNSKEALRFMSRHELALSGAGDQTIETAVPCGTVP